ncbi:MAG: TIGR03364 family FAD-dependent oxidoreductase [Phenylobacterium sp.]|nr:TIGR03364 family FAD-dependent oxidoreductase [Phenylobacterium sp.]
MSASVERFDLAVVGGGILGLAHAYLAARAGLKVCVVERHARAIGASIRNFGFITVTGQARGEFWRLAQRTCRTWREVAPLAGVPILHEGMTLAVRSEEARDLLSAFLDTEMGQGCAMIAPQDAGFPLQPGVLAALRSPHEVRVESREAIPKLTAWLAEAFGVEFRFGVHVHAVSDGGLQTSAGPVRADRVVVCPGDDLNGLFADRIRERQVTRCQLQMLRLADPGFRLPTAVMSDLGLIRYLGYAQLPQAAPLRERLAAEAPEALAEGVHLIVVQSGDGSLVVGDSHRYGDAPDPFASERVDALILEEYRRVLGEPPPVVDRWTGTYASSDRQLFFIDAPHPAVRLVAVTCGAGASTSFGIAEQTLQDMGVL